MKVTEIQSHNVSQRIVVPFPIYWSQDDTVGVATDKGIQIMEILFNPNNKTKAIGCNRYYVDINDNTPTSFVGINTSSLFLKVDTSEAFNLILNQDLVPKLDKAATFQPLVKQIEASPAKGVNCFGRCIFGYVTNSGQLSLIGYKYNDWSEVLDLSKLWVVHCKTVCWGPVSQSTKHQISELTYRVAKIKFTSFTWSTLPISEAECVSLLITASQDGIITLWKVFNKTNGAQETNNTNVDNGCSTEISASVINCFNSELSFVTALSWYGLESNNGYLIIGNNKGLISYINVSYVNSGDILTKKEDIWAIDDKIPITKIICWYYNKGFICVAVKGSFIVISYVDIADNKLLSVCYHNTAMRFITGVEKMEDNSVLVSSRNGDFRLISLQFIDDNITVDENEIGCGFVKQKYALHGFHLSRNKVMGVAVLSVSGPFDHLIVREPSNMVVFSLSEVNEPLKLLLYKNEQINYLWDCLEVVRWQILNKVIAYELPGNLHTELDTMELKQLIITMWLTKFLAMASENDEVEEGEGEDGEINKEKSTALMNIFEEIEELVFTSNIFKRCANLITNVMNLSTFDKESLSLIIKWFDHLILSLPESYITTRSSASTLLDEVNDTLNKNTLVLFDFEECCICKSQVPCLTGFKTSRCIRNHALSRCSLSFIQCSYEKIYRCTRCGALAHQNAVTEECENCIFCDNVLRKDNRLLDILDEETEDEDVKPDTS